MSAEGGGDPAKAYFLSTGILQILPFVPIDQDGKQGTLELDMSWQKAAHQYSSRIFSDPADRLRALQGVQRLYSATKKERFILGLRSSAFAEDLLWSLELGRVGRCSDFTSNLPTWSWLSYNGQISYNQDEGNRKFTRSQALTWRTLQLDRSGNVTNLPLLIEGKIRTVLLRPIIGQDLREECWRVDCYGETDFWNAEKQQYEDDPARSHSRPIGLHPLGKVTLDSLDASKYTNRSKSDGPDYTAKPLELECLFLGEQGPETRSIYTSLLAGGGRQMTTLHKYVVEGDGKPSGTSSRLHGRSARGIIVERNREGKYQRCGMFLGAPTSSFYFQEAKKRAIYLH